MKMMSEDVRKFSTREPHSENFICLIIFESPSPRTKALCRVSWDSGLKPEMRGAPGGLAWGQTQPS